MRPTIFLLAPLFAGCLTSCETIVPTSERQSSAPMAVVPQKFLYNTYEPLNTWLDTPVEVYMIDIPVEDVFNQPVFADLNYEITNIPDSGKLVNIESFGITRRQLLWAIAHDNGLRMRARHGSEDAESFIEITGRSRSTGDERS
ncbi:hypothetical protein OAF27_02750 [Verrucomicrobiales bacterium]|nr:hypothetical protein [Verrucomicrobiales bacterium]